MPTFKAFIKTTLSLYVVSFLVGCNLPSPKDKEEVDKGNASATFSAQAKADASKAIETAVAGNFSLPSSKIFNLQACLKDIAYDKPIAGHDFLIEEINKKVTSDKSGCVTWPEKIEFNYLGDSQYILIKRHIQGTGFHKGLQKVSYAINPWSHGETLPAVLDPDDNKIEKLASEEVKISQALKGFSADNHETKRPLWVEDARLFVSEQKLSAEGIVLDVELRATPAIKLSKMNGDIFFRPLSSGKFHAGLKLIHTYSENDKEIHRLLTETTVQNSKMENGSLIIKSALKLSAIPTRGQVMLALELLPLDGPQGLKTFEGVYLLGEYDQLKGSTFLKISSSVTEKEDFKIANFITSNLKDLSLNEDKKGLESDTYQKPKVEVAPLEFRFLRIGQEKTSSREIIYTVRACIRHGLDQKSIRAQTFKITKFRKSEQETEQTTSIKTDNNSCINWDESFTYKYFESQHYIKGFVLIENSNLGMKEKIDIAINPWDKYSLDARDLRYEDPSKKMPLNFDPSRLPKSWIKIPSYSYSKNSYKYSVDKYLNLTVIKKVQLILEPRLIIYSSLSDGREESQKLRDGIYLLKTAVIQNKDYDTNNTYVTSDEKIVTVTDGRIEAEISFQIWDLKALGNNNNFLVELYPVDENKIEIQERNIKVKNPHATLDSVIDSSSGLVSPTFIGTVVINNDEASRLLRLMDPSSINQFLLNGQISNKETGFIDTIVAQGQKAFIERNRQIQDLAKKETYAKENNLDLISLKTSDEQAPLIKSLIGSSTVNRVNILDKQDLNQLIETGILNTHTAHKLCAFWATDYLRIINSAKGGSILPQIASRFAKTCMSGVLENVSTFFQFEKHLRINEVGDAERLKGYSQGIPLSTSFSITKSHSKTDSNSTSVSMKASIPIIEVGGGLSQTWTTSDSDSSSNSVSISNSTPLNMLQDVLKIRVKSHEQCAIVRLNPSLFIRKKPTWLGLLTRRDYLGIMNPNLSKEELAVATNRGLMICTGEMETEPKDIIENYYLISQEPPTQGHQQDNGDAKNRNFFVALRSKNDYNRFLLSIKEFANAPATADKEENRQEENIKNIEQIFHLSGSAYPSVFR